MNADETGTVVKPHKGYKCVLAITAVIPVLVCWFVWGLLSIIFYVDGLFNSKVAFGIGPILIPSVLVVGLLLSMRLVSCILRRCGLSTRRIRRGVLAMMFVFGLAALFGLNYMGLSLDPLSMFARGISRHVERRADIAEVRVGRARWTRTTARTSDWGTRSLPIETLLTRPSTCRSRLHLQI